MQTQPAGARLPLLARLVISKARQLLPRPASVGGAEERRVLDAGVDGVGIGRRRLDVPHAREFPWMLRAVVPLVRARNPVVGELVAHRLPGLPAVVGTLHDLAVP